MSMRKYLLFHFVYKVIEKSVLFHYLDMIYLINFIFSRILGYDRCNILILHYTLMLITLKAPSKIAAYDTIILFN